MEKAKQDAFDNARLQVIKDGYERAFECLNKGLTVDEAGDKAQALELYKRGRQHLLRAISVPSQGEECVGSSWESARKMQQKMQETLNNITTRMAILETSSDVGSAPAPGVSAPDAAGPSGGGLYPALPTKKKPGRPAAPNLASANGAVGGMQCSGEGLPVSPSRQPVVAAEQPPAYSPQAADGHLSISYGTEAGEMSLVGDEFYSRTSSSTPSPQSVGEEGEEMLYIPHGVQIFFVTPEGQVSAPSYPGYLRLVKFTRDHSDTVPNRPPAFLQVCDWLYPLMAMDSPVLLCNTGVFMFPDMMAPTPGYYVGVVLSSELPAADRVLFQDLLSQMTDLRVQAPDEAAESINLSQKVPITTLEETAPEATEPTAEETEEDKPLPEWSEKVANGILTGASWLSWGLVKGAEFTGKAIHKGASKLREHITPEDKPTQVSPTVTKGLHVAKQATGGAVKVSQFLVDGVCVVAGCVGRELAPHVKKHGGKLIPESMKKDKDGRSNIDGAMVVAASGVQGFATMWTGLEVAAKDITSSVASETVTTVKHKYGAAAGQATDHAVNSAINVGITAFNVDNLGIKAVVKRTGRHTAQAILEDHNLQEKPENRKQVEKSNK
ncbi:spartin b isoform X1 [Morone saxatilis]|uniref:spartin b isoform X1 n=1 Tax=Morone saxatilis TaxID=34816 RepID=UPI0015E24C2F|nr:spartin b isoform X1 [Morone saxatilis]XP_035536096.1 spartin b isoform X1 [Morone saxatilis]XP_035536097.1 spartin b isoform X1 [Morone saxatilis]XP_035536098.1 spartin b isoform X1 [Morone saxatilis]XP_035536099.1 spartin b isoform X1 [Morone saxatilis]XP_035536100.1 spartin b isoform X1 [Morone saxatilis]